MSLDVQPFEPRHLDGAARVLAAQYAETRAAVPSLPERFEQPAVAREHLAGLTDDGRATGVVALRDGLVVGYLTAAVTEPDPSTIDAVYVPMRSARVSYSGTAATGDAGRRTHARGPRSRQRRPSRGLARLLPAGPGGARAGGAVHRRASARDRFDLWCAVSWDSANLESSRFWLGHGFRPIAARVYRLLDERILWATAADH